MKRLAAVIALGSLAAWGVACDQQGGGGARIGDNPKQSELPQVQVKLPPPPSFQKEHAPASYPDGSASVYGLRADMKGNLNKPAKVKGFVIDVYECPSCPKGSTCKPCNKPHLWLSDRANGPKDKALMVTDFPEKHPSTNKKIKWEVGAQYYISGTFSRSSATGFSSSDGLLVFADSMPVPQAAE